MYRLQQTKSNYFNRKERKDKNAKGANEILL